MSLKSRSLFPPGGWIFIQPETKFVTGGGLTHDQTVRQIIEHRKSNPELKARYSITFAEVSQELCYFRCQMIGYDPAWCHPPTQQQIAQMERKGQSVLKFVRAGSTADLTAKTNGKAKPTCKTCRKRS